MENSGLLNRFGQSMHANRSGRLRRACRGHSMVEVLLSLIFFAPALLVVVLLGKYLDIKQTTREAGRYAVWERTVWSDSGEWNAEENTKSDDRIRLEIDRRLYGHPSQGLDSRENELARGITDNPLWTTVDTEMDMFNDSEDPEEEDSGSESGEHPILNGVEAGGRTLRAQLELYENEPPSSLVVDEVAGQMNLGERNFAVATVMVPVKNHTVFGDDLVMRSHAAILTNAWSAPSEDKFEDRVDEVVFDEAATAITAPAFVIAGIGAIAGLYIDGFDAGPVEASVDSTVLPDYLLRDEAPTTSGSGQSTSGQTSTTSSTAGSTSTSEDGDAASDGDESTSGSDQSNGDGQSDPSTSNSSTPAFAEDAISDALETYSPEEDGYHDYTTGPNLVCTAEQACTAQEIADQLSRFAVPGQDPSIPVQDGSINPVYDPRFDIPVSAGNVTTEVGPDGLTIVNTTEPGHVFHDGAIVRYATQVDGAWYVTTRGIGNNERLGAATINENQGPEIFNFLDEQMRNNIDAHH